MPGADRPAPTCPRCAYDQSGVVATWADSCPLAGVCSECGAAFEWGDVFDRDRGRIRGFFEHAAGWRRWIAWSLVTLAWTVVPAVFWRRVGPEEPWLRRRIWAWPFVAAAPAWILGSVANCGTGLIVVLVVWRSPVHLSQVLNGWTEPFGRFTSVGISSLGVTGLVGSWEFRVNDEWLRPVGVTCVLWLVWPLVIGLLSVLPSAELWPRNWFLRATLYSLAWFPLLTLVRAVEGLWWLLIASFHETSGVVRSGRPVWSPADMLLTAFPWATGVWLAAWWWCALSRLLGRREAVRFWVAGVVFGGIAAVGIDSMSQIRLAQTP